MLYTQVWCTLIAQLLMTVIQKIAQTKKAFSVVASLIRIHLISMLDMVELLRSTSRAYKIQVGEPPDQLQLNLLWDGGLFFNEKLIARKLDVTENKIKNPDYSRLIV